VPLTLDILEIGARGDGIAERDGERYFVPFTLPGEVVEAEPIDKRGDGIAAGLVTVAAPSRDRVAAPCAHFGICGGCALQHWQREAYTAWKVGLIERALKQRGVAAPAFEPPLFGAPGERRRVDVVLRRQGKRVLAGFHERGSARIVDVGLCVIARPTLTALLEPLRAAFLQVLPDGAAADAVVNETDSGLDVLIRPHKRLDLSLDRRQALVGLAERANLARLSWGDRATSEPIVMRRPPLLILGDVSVEPPPGAFLQATKRGEQTMRAAVNAWVGKAAKLADLFAGLGSLSLGRQAIAVRERQAVGRGDRGGGAQARRQPGDCAAARLVPQSAGREGAQHLRCGRARSVARGRGGADRGDRAFEGAADRLCLVRFRHLRARRARAAGRRIPAGETAADRSVPVVGASGVDRAVHAPLRSSKAR
jgi:23S rRNA (uracil1939-C5)-methyltransferase